jgi:hypothetical protein
MVHKQAWSIKNYRYIGDVSPVDPNNLTRREVVDSQLNATALHMIQIAIGSKDLPHIQHFSTTKEA